MSLERFYLPVEGGADIAERAVIPGTSESLLLAKHNVVTTQLFPILCIEIQVTHATTEPVALSKYLIVFIPRFWVSSWAYVPSGLRQHPHFLLI